MARGGRGMSGLWQAFKAWRRVRATNNRLMAANKALLQTKKVQWYLRVSDEPNVSMPKYTPKPWFQCPPGPGPARTYVYREYP